MEKERKALVVFGDSIPESIQTDQYAEVIMAKDFTDPGSIYEATALVEELAKLNLPNGGKLSKSFLYEGYELWWIHYNDLFYYFGLPFSQYKKLLNRIKDLKNIELYKPPFKSLFAHFLAAYGCKVNIVANAKTERILPFGILIQILLTMIFAPLLIIKRPKFLVFTGDKFENNRDFDFRMRFVYKALRERNLRFVEFIRSLESWKTVFGHAKRRMRPVVYSEAIMFVGRFLSHFIGSKFRSPDLSSISNPDQKFKILVGTHYLKSVSADIWSIRISRWIIELIGIRAAYFSAALDRNYPAVLGCKLNSIPTVGILHGVASKYYNGYDFLPGFSGEKSLSLDRYGVWSEWWKEYYIKHSNTYKPEQLYISGPIRPIEKGNDTDLPVLSGPIKVLFVSEQLAAPQEIVPYLETLLKQPDMEITFTFRQHKDGFKDWLLKNRPEFLQNPQIKITSGGLLEAITTSDVAVGSHSTAVLEMLLKQKAPLFFGTKKWGDYYGLREYDTNKTFFAENPDELIEKIKKVRSISKETLLDLQNKYFGDPYKNGSKWVVDELVTFFEQQHKSSDKQLYF